ncbi:heteromeric transposase endonuclease subunit TnsA [Sphingomonas sp. TF3]|nr:heteromeric transposase endonuclease subunit TnsA [Sphingomonas sp. TF3]
MGGSRYALSERKISRWTKEARGLGRGASYRPWLTMHDVPSHGLSVRVLGVTTGRIHQLLSGVERAVFLECDWSHAVTDIREQFPLPRDVTRRIAQEMGVVHPADGRVDVVMTTDLLLDVNGVDQDLSFELPPGTGRRRLAISIKSREEQLTLRERDKLEIERRYWRGLGITWLLLFLDDIPEDQWRKLMWLHEWFTLDFMGEDAARLFRAKCDRVLVHLACAQDQRAGGFMERVDADEQWTPGTTLAAIRHLAANGRVTTSTDRLYDAWGPLGQFTVAAQHGALARSA